MKKNLGVLGAGLIFIFVGFTIFSMTPAGVAFFNNWKYDLQKVDDVTNYDTLKEVEDTCRAMITSYESDKLIYEQYKDSTDEDEQTWAQQAKIRANKTATSYNNYILKNNYVWKSNVPSDIRTELKVIE